MHIITGKRKQTGVFAKAFKPAAKVAAKRFAKVEVDYALAA